MSQHPSQHHVDSTHLSVQDREFRAGFAFGQLVYQARYQHHRPTPASIYDGFVSLVLDPFHSTYWTSGYVVGWIAGLLGVDKLPDTSAERKEEP